MEKKLKVIATTLTPYDGRIALRKIEEILKKEKKRHPNVPILMVLPEEGPGRNEPEINGMLMRIGRKGKVENAGSMDYTVEKLREAAEKYDAHILFAGPEKINFKRKPKDSRFKEGPMISMFVVNGKGIATVRRKLLLDKKVSPLSLKTLRINGFKVLPLICWEFLHPMTAVDLQWKEKLKNSDIIAVSAKERIHDTKHMGEEEPEHYRKGMRRMKRLELTKKGSLVVISNAQGEKDIGLTFYKEGYKAKFDSFTKPIHECYNKPHRYGMHILTKELPAKTPKRRR